MTDDERIMLRRLADHEAIRTCLMRYARGIDRVDEALLRQVYWPEAVDNHGSYNGPVDGFIAWVIPLLRTMSQTMHLLGNMLIEVEGDHGCVETYFTASHRLPDISEGWREIMVVGRYVDRMERRSGEWRILERNVAYDGYAETPRAADWARCRFGLDHSTHRYPDDISYDLFQSSRPAEARSPIDIPRVTGVNAKR